MAAPEIPNLLSLLPSRNGTARNARTSARSRGGSSNNSTSRIGPTPHGPTPNGPIPPRLSSSSSSRPTNHQTTSTNATIAATDTDAAGSRLSAVRAGWLADAYAEALYAAPGAQSVRRMPIINRGTYVRTTAIDELVREFLGLYIDADLGFGSQDDQACQVISLGAGTDTRWARLFSQDARGRARMRGCRWIEVDFAETIEVKRGMLERVGLGDVVAEGQAWTGVGMDLRELVGGDAEDGQEWKVEDTKLGQVVDSRLPTLLLSEMCLTYLPPSTASTPVLAAIAGRLIAPPTRLHMVLYEPLAPHDAFGRTMIQNLAGRGIRLPGLEELPSLESHGQRLKDVGFDGWKATTVAGWWRDRISSGEKDRLRAVEMVDEEEEWDLLAGHYGLIWGWRGQDPGQ